MKKFKLFSNFLVEMSKYTEKDRIQHVLNFCKYIEEKFYDEFQLILNEKGLKIKYEYLYTQGDPLEQGTYIRKKFTDINLVTFDSFSEEESDHFIMYVLILSEDSSRKWKIEDRVCHISIGFSEDSYNVTLYSGIIKHRPDIKFNHLHSKESNYKDISSLFKTFLQKDS
jgi:hypothetical protein